MNAMRDIETQRRGVVAIAYFVGQKLKRNDMDGAFQTRKFFDSLPMRLVAAHACIDSDILRPFIALTTQAFNNLVKSRCRIHFGKPHCKQRKTFCPLALTLPSFAYRC